MKKHLSTVIILFLLSFSVAAEQTAYITDSLLLRVYANPDDNSEVIVTLESGDSIEVLEEQGAFSHIRTYEGTTGWVKSAFIVEEPPAKLLYYTVDEKNKELEAQVDKLKNQIDNHNNDSGNERIIQLEQELAEQQNINQQLNEQLNSLQGNNSQQSSFNTDSKINDTLYAITKLQNDPGKVIIWFGIFLVALVVGLLLGMKLSSNRLRKRLHGFRLE